MYLVHNDECGECTNTLIPILLVRLFSPNVLGYSPRINVRVVPALEEYMLHMATRSSSVWGELYHKCHYTHCVFIVCTVKLIWNISKFYHVFPNIFPFLRHFHKNHNLFLFHASPKFSLIFPGWQENFFKIIFQDFFEVSLKFLHSKVSRTFSIILPKFSQGIPIIFTECFKFR